MIQEIDISKLKVHPKNVRKTYNNIDELADSIKAQGILQNLTVVPDPDENGCYLVVIGNRRLTAAKKAGLKTAPCYVADMDEKDQASTMLLENMQRDDLTIYEQAQGFQMVLDLGETVEGLCEKTGLSKTTINRRLNIAKLDQNLLSEKENDGEFQLQLKDLYELEKVKDIEKRNEILSKATDSNDLAWRARNAVLEAKREDAKKKIIKMAEKAGIEKAPDQASSEIYTGKWETVKTYSLDEDIPEKIEVECGEKDKIYYLAYYREVKIIRKTKKVKKEKTPEELKRDEKDSRKKKIKAIAKNMAASRREFILNIISGKIDTPKDTDDLQLRLWDIMRKSSSFVSNSGFTGFIAGKDYYNCTPEEKASAEETIGKLSVVEQELIVSCNALKESEFTDWQGNYKKETGETFKELYEVLKKFGYSYNSDEEQKIVEGTHELYFYDEEENNK